MDCVKIAVLSQIESQRQMLMLRALYDFCVHRSLMPLVSKFNWSSAEELGQWDPSKRQALYSAILKDAESLRKKTVAFGCSGGRTRSPTCAVLFILSLLIGKLSSAFTCTSLASLRCVAGFVSAEQLGVDWTWTLTALRKARRMLRRWVCGWLPLYMPVTQRFLIAHF